VTHGARWKRRSGTQFQEEIPISRIQYCRLCEKSLSDLIRKVWTAVCRLLCIALLITLGFLPYWFTWCFAHLVGTDETTLIAVSGNWAWISLIGFGLPGIPIMAGWPFFDLPLLVSSHGVEEDQRYLHLQVQVKRTKRTDRARRTFRQLFLPGQLICNFWADAVGWLLPWLVYRYFGVIFNGGWPSVHSVVVAR